MQALAKISTLGTPYTASQIYSLLCSTGTEQWAFDWLGPDGSYRGDLTPWVTDIPAVAHDSTQAVKRTLKIRLEQTSLSNYGSFPEVDVFADLIRVRYRIPTPDGGFAEWTIGVFCQSTLQRAINPGFTKLDLAFNDLSQLLVDDKFESAYAVNAGASMVTAVAAIVRSYTGQTQLHAEIPDSGYVLGKTISWNAGDNKLQAITDVLTAGNYYSPWMDGFTLRSRPIPDMNTVVPGLTWDATNGQSPVTATAPNETIDRTSAANVITVIGNTPTAEGTGTPGPAPQATYVNDRPDSPVSTVRWGKRVAKMIQDGTITDVPTAAIRARNEAQLAARLYSAFSIGTLPWPLSDDHDFYTLIYNSSSEGVVNEVYEDLSWSMNCAPGNEQSHTLQRLVAS